MKIDENMENGLYCSIDWLSFTVLDNVDLDTVFYEQLQRANKANAHNDNPKRNTA